MLKFDDSLPMTEPASSTAVGYLAAKFGAALGAGVLGAMAMAAFDPPRSKMQILIRAAVAGVCSIQLTPLATRWFDSAFDFVNLANGDIYDALEVVLPIGFVIGALSWGLIGALATLRRIIGERGGQRMADAAGLADKQP